jgi:hypothetical protein
VGFGRSLSRFGSLGKRTMRDGRGVGDASISSGYTVSYMGNDRRIPGVGVNILQVHLASLLVTRRRSCARYLSGAL